MTAILEIRGITKKFGGLTAVNHVDLTLNPGELRCIIGPNGCGKTTLLHTLAGLLVPQAGQIIIGATNIENLTRRNIAQQLGLLLQHQECESCKRQPRIFSFN